VTDRERIERYVDAHPDADVIEVLGHLGLGPTDRDVVEAVLDEDTDESRVEPGNGGNIYQEDAGTAYEGHERGRVRTSFDGRWTRWADADFTDPESRVWSPERLAEVQWMGHVEKKPFSPWANRDHPEAAADEDARWKWGLSENYVDGETVSMAEVDPRLDGRAFIQLEDDPYAYVDGDDVRDPETGEVHPAFVAILEHLGATYADVSQSGAGVHAIYRGELPEGVKQADWQLDTEPWGSNDDLPSVEIYAGKRVCVETGEHVPSTPTEINDWDDDSLATLVEINDDVASSQRVDDDVQDLSTDPDDYDLEEYEPSATDATETTDDIRDVFAALDRLDARRVAERTIVSSWNDDASTSEGYRAFHPKWGGSSNGTANIVNDRIWQDTGDVGGYGGPVVMALIDAGEMSPHEASPRNARGALWFRGIEHLRMLDFDIPKLERSNDSGPGSDGDDDLPDLLEDALEHDEDIDSAPTSSLPLGQLDALAPDERRRAAQKRGLSWPTTREARDKLFATIGEAMRHEDETVIDAPTSLGKSHTVVTTPWAAEQHQATTGGQPVVHLSATRDARDEAIEAAREAEVDYFALRSRHEACPVAAGDHDPEHCQESDRQPVTIRGEPASEWLTDMCEGRGIAFSAAHRFLERHNDQGTKLPCCRGSKTTYDKEEGDFDDGEPSECPAIKQWEDLRDIRDSNTRDLSVIIATHNFAHVPGLRAHTNVVIDEEPDFTADISKDRIERAITAYLKEIDAPVQTWESFIQTSLHDGWEGDAARERDALRDQLDEEPDREWYFEEPDAHTLAPALARAIFHAEERGNGRRFGKTPHEPPRLDAHVSDDQGWNREWVSVVLDEDNAIRTVRTAPDLSQARSVIGLGAHPAQPVWSVNTVPHIDTTEVLRPEERRLWRRFERGLRVVQVGDATRPLASGEYFNEDQVEALVEHLVDEYGEWFRTAITAGAVEDRLAEVMDEAGVRLDRDEDGNIKNLMHFGEEKSRNDFANERAGLIEGCIDPGDDYVVDLLAELDCDAEPTIVDCGHCDGTGECDGHCELESCHPYDSECGGCDGSGEQRENGRTFSGEDADVATEVLASVRENHTAQAAGRYARNPDDPDSHATVFVRTDAMPPGFADIQVPGVEWCFTDTQRAIVETLRESTTSRTTREVAEEVGCSKEHVRSTLRRLEEQGSVDAFERSGTHGATLYADSGLPTSGAVDLGAEESANSPVLDSYTWALAVSDPAAGGEGDLTETVGGSTAESTIWDWEKAASGPPGGGSEG